MSTNKIHPAATLIPEPDTEQYERLKQDIREHGLRAAAALSWSRAAGDLLAIFDRISERHVQAA